MSLRHDFFTLHSPPTKGVASQRIRTLHKDDGRSPLCFLMMLLPFSSLLPLLLYCGQDFIKTMKKRGELTPSNSDCFAFVSDVIPTTAAGRRKKVALTVCLLLVCLLTVNNILVANHNINSVESQDNLNSTLPVPDAPVFVWGERDFKRSTKVNRVEVMNGKNVTVQVVPSGGWFQNPKTSDIKATVQKWQKRRNEKPAAVKIDRIYYINLQKNIYRRQFMEGWLSKQPTPYERVQALVGDPDSCVAAYNNSHRCQGMSGLIKTGLHIMENYNTTGLTLVLEDDFKVLNMNRLLASIPLARNNWDILRWDCYGRIPINFKHVAPYTFRTRHVQECASEPGLDWKTSCTFCGGTHAMLWRKGHAGPTSSSIDRLKRLWGKMPYDDIDCRLSEYLPEVPPFMVKSYCINIGIGKFHFYQGEEGDLGPNPYKNKTDQELGIVQL
jgi:hypothetical protein